MAKGRPINDKFKVGTTHTVQATGKTLTGIAFGAGYYMCRYKGCYPFILDEKGLVNLIQ